MARVNADLTRAQLSLLRAIRAQAAADSQGRELTQVWVRTYQYGSATASLEPQASSRRPPGWGLTTYRGLQDKGLIVRSANQVRLTLAGDKRG